MDTSTTAHARTSTITASAGSTPHNNSPHAGSSRAGGRRTRQQVPLGLQLCKLCALRFGLGGLGDQGLSYPYQRGLQGVLARHEL
jgi:hypothetical protein